MIKYNSYSIFEKKNIETGKVIYELKHWYQSDICPETLGAELIGYFKSYKEANDKHNEIMKLKEKAANEL